MMRNYQFTSVKNYLYTYNSIIKLTSSEISLIKPTNNITIDYIEYILPLHNSGIHICNNVLNYATKDFIIKYANKIIDLKKNEIEELKTISHTTYGFINQEKNVKIYLNDYYTIYKESTEKVIPTYNSIFLNYKSEILHYFETLNRINKNVLQYYIDPRLRSIIENSMIKYNELEEELNNL